MSTAGSAPSSSPSRGTRAARGRRKKAPVVPDEPGLARIVAIANQKGGVGKSTTAVSLGAALADLGYRVLVVDLDPQGNASTGLGIRHEARTATVYDVIVGERPITEAVIATQVARLYGVTSTIDLAGAEIELVSQFSREGRLKKALEPIREGMFDYILLDCPPSLGLLTVNALTAAEELIVPIQCEYYALEGLGQLLKNVGLVQHNINPELRLTGIVMTMFDPRTKLSEQVVAEVQRHFGDLVYDVVIPRTVRLSEAPGFGQPITVYDPRSRGAETYRELAREVALRPPPETPMPSFDELPEVVVPRVPADAVTPNGLAEDATEVVADEPDAGPGIEALSQPGPETPPSEPTVEVEAAPEIEATVEVEAAPEIEATVEVDSNPETVAEPQPGGESPLAAESEAGSRSSAGSGSGAGVERPPAAIEWSEEEPEPPRVRPAPGRAAGEGSMAPRRVVVIDDDADLEALARRRARPSPAPEADREPDEGVSPIGATLHDEQAPRRRWRLFRKGGEE